MAENKQQIKHQKIRGTFFKKIPCELKRVIRQEQSSEAVTVFVAYSGRKMDYLMATSFPIR